MKRFYSSFSVILLSVILFWTPFVCVATVSISDIPLYLTVTAPPAVLFNVSVEGPMGGAAYSGTYSDTDEYLGIFDATSCYTYNLSGTGASGMTGRFEPSTNKVDTHKCGSSQWSGNFLNWTTMRAIDMFIWNLTGGNRVVDTAGSSAATVLRAARKSGWFSKRSDVVIPPGAATVSGTYDITYPNDYNFKIGDGSTYNIQVQVCKSSSPGPESNCSAYTDNASSPHTYYKPEGLIQKNAEKMRFALTSYTLDDSQDRDGGVLRSNMKYVGPRKWDDTARAWVDNDAKEWWGTTSVTGGSTTACNSSSPTTPGVLISYPEQCNADSNLKVSTSTNLNSGIINYINKFSDQGYKSYDPAGELFYESLNYFRAKGPTPEYSGADNSNGRNLSAITRNSSDSRAGRFWFYNKDSEWKDPIIYSCQRNFIVAINDANPWLDKRLPGTYFTADTIDFTTNSNGRWRGTSACMSGSGCNVVGSDYGEPSTESSTDRGAFSIESETNKVGNQEGLNNITWDPGPDDSRQYYPGIAINGVSVTGTITDSIRGILWQKDSVGGAVSLSGYGTFDNSCSSKLVTNLGRVFGTCPAAYKQNSYYIAGLASWANTNFIRTDKKVTVNTFVIDTQEPQPGTNILDGPRNMLWLAGKYGGFIDKNGSKTPDLTEEWDKDGDGIPDNYVFASDPSKLQSGLNKAFSNIYDLSATSADSSSSSVATNSTRLDTGSVVYQMKFHPSNWTGQILAETLNQNGTVKAVVWDSDTTLGRLKSSEAESRQILTWNPDNKVGALFKCTGSNAGKSWMDPTVTSNPDNSNCWLTTTQRAALQESSLTSPLATGVNWDDLLNYLRGDPTNETDQVGGRHSFRFRKMTLGDIINSDPLFIGDENLGYDVLPDDEGGGTTYAAYRYQSEARQKMLYVGANDGMFHGFNSTTGAEVFAYVPNEVIRDSNSTDRMKLLASFDYSHRYFVDGSSNFGDVYTTSGWKTYLVSSLGAGGRAVFALDISAGSTAVNGVYPVTMSASKVRWEFGPNSDSHTTNSKSSEIGYVLSQPQIVRLPNKRWAAFFGNGPGGSSGRAFLFAIYLDADLTDGWDLGRDYLVFATDTATSNANIIGNGLSGVAVVGDSSMTATVAYAGDLLGRLWKFDLSGITNSSMSCSSTCGSGTLLFSAQSNQPITATPAVGVNSTCSANSYMVYFGTGKYYETGDQTNVDLQSLYGIWDQPGGTTNLTISDLYKYEIDNEGTASSGTEWRVIADNNTTKITDLYASSKKSGDVCKNSPDSPVKRGWYIDLKVKGSTTNTGERVIVPALLRHDRAIFTTLEPSQAFCSPGGKSWVMEMTAQSGAPLTYGIFDINNDNSISSSTSSTDTGGACGDCVKNSAGQTSLVSGVSTGDMGIIKTPTIVTAGDVEYKLGSGSAEGELVVIKEKGSTAPRASWRQLQ